MAAHVGPSLSWLARDVGGSWRIESTARRDDLPQTVTISAIALGARIGAMMCRRLSRDESVVVLRSRDRMAA